jgi:hypothetical protein
LKLIEGKGESRMDKRESYRDQLKRNDAKLRELVWWFWQQSVPFSVSVRESFVHRRGDDFKELVLRKWREYDLRSALENRLEKALKSS